MGDLAPEIPLGVPFDIAYRIERDTYQGESRLQLRIADIRLPGASSAPENR
jgi:hypothetical protein